MPPIEADGRRLIDRVPERGYWILGHRGSRNTAAGNSIRAFDLALEMGADGIELDLRRTNDGHWVAYHDKTFVSGGKRQRVARMLRERLGADVAEIDTIVDWIAAHPETLVDVEIKDPGFEAELVEPFRPLVDQIVFTSYIPDILWGIKKGEARFRTGLLTTHPGLFHLEIARMAGCDVVVWHDSDATEERVRRALDRELKPWVWGVTSRRRMAQLASWGVRAIITDRIPPAARVGKL